MNILTPSFHHKQTHQTDPIQSSSRISGSDFIQFNNLKKVRLVDTMFVSPANHRPFIYAYLFFPVCMLLQAGPQLYFCVGWGL